MPLVGDIARTYRAPREAVARRLQGAPREERALAVLLGACGLMFLAQWPRLVRDAGAGQGPGLEAMLAGALMGWMFLAPLAFYIVAALVHLLMRVSGAGGSAYGARVATFWSLIAAAPLWLLQGLVYGLGAPAIAADVVGTAAIVAFFMIWFAGLQASREAEAGLVR